jgi:hypothetical protein
MRGIVRLVEGLLRGEAEAVYVLVFAVAGTLLIVLITGSIRRRRRQQRDEH